MTRLLVCALAEDHHDPGRGHPEQPGRLEAALAGLRDAASGEAFTYLPGRPASRAELSVVHDPGYLDALAELCAAGGGALDPDTTVSVGSWDTARLTAGAGLTAVAALRADRGDAAFVLGRPPGHHATRDTGMGFCLINNVAVCAATLAAGGERVAIIDWDVHHGNGTQEIFWFDSRVLYVSIHQWPLYPGTGRPDERGAGDGRGATINMPLPPRATGDVYLSLFDEIIAPSVERFGATWILVSAGFDAHRNDPLADMRLTAGDYADLTGRAAALIARRGRLMLFLEGGYYLPAVRASVGACAARLVDAAYRPEAASSGGEGRGLVEAYRSRLLEPDPEEP
jgi:acetoin utilization deacetylase AcuC-like enzyme